MDGQFSRPAMAAAPLPVVTDEATPFDNSFDALLPDLPRTLNTFTDDITSCHLLCSTVTADVTVAATVIVVFPFKRPCE